MNVALKKEDHEIYKLGDFIFKKGDPGGDLLFIVEGRVEVFITKDGVDSVLAVMGPSEVLGVASCLTNSPRLASSKALDDCVLKRVKYQQIMKVMGQMPDWVKILLKDLNHRLDYMNDQYIIAEQKIKILKDQQKSLINSAQQICSYAAQSSEYFAITVNDEKMVVTKDLQDKSIEALSLSEKVVGEIVSCFTENGLLVELVESECKRKVVKLAQVKQLPEFSRFIDEYQSPKYKKIRKAQLTPKALKILLAMVQLAIKEGKNIKEMVSYGESYLAENLKSKMNIGFDKQMIKPVLEAELLEAKEEEELSYTFVPQTLINILPHLISYITLRQRDDDLLMKAIKVKKED